MSQKMVARFKNGTVLKGYTFDFAPNRDKFHLRLEDANPSDKPIEVLLDDLKAVFFVKKFEGNPDYNEDKSFPQSQTLYGQKVIVNFKDGETLVGTCNAYHLDQPGFFFFPVDKQSNNMRVFAVSKFINDISEVNM